MAMTPRPQRRTAAERDTMKPHIAEWFGHRVFPTVADHTGAQADQRGQTCPFLSQVAERHYECVKSENSAGVCTISAGSNGRRQDWLVCPFRVMDDDLLNVMVRRLYSLGAQQDIHVIPVTNLSDPAVRHGAAVAVNDPLAPRQFVVFQQLFGGEIGVSKTTTSPELSFDSTVVELLPTNTGSGVRLGRYGIIEIQTADTHGTYKHAVSAMRSALDLHGDDFGRQVAAHPDWPGRRIEGPNISNVFKRTFYQMMFKFQITRRETSAGCILALPEPVWDSWQPFLGAPRLVDLPDGTARLVGRTDRDDSDPVVRGEVVPPPNWIFIFSIEDSPPADGEPTRISINKIVSTDAPSLSRLALDVAPSEAAGLGTEDDVIAASVERRIARLLPGWL